MAESISACPYCEAPLTGARRAQCGQSNCRRQHASRLERDRLRRKGEVEPERLCVTCGGKVVRRAACGPWPKYCTERCQADARLKVIAERRLEGKRGRICAYEYCRKPLPDTSSTQKRYCDQKCGWRAQNGVVLGKRHCATCSVRLPDSAPLIAKYCSKSCKWKADGERRSEYVKTYQEKYRAANAQRLQEWQADYRARNRQALAEKTKREYAKNPLPWKNARDRRRARIRSAAETRTVSTRDWQRMLLAYSHRCAYCGIPGDLTMDHVIPISRGGRHAIGNLVPACLTCNLMKNALLLVEWKLRKQRRGVGDAMAPIATRRTADSRLGSSGLDHGEPLSA